MELKTDNRKESLKEKRAVVEENFKARELSSSASVNEQATSSEVQPPISESELTSPTKVLKTSNSRE